MRNLAFASLVALPLSISPVFAQELPPDAQPVRVEGMLPPNPAPTLRVGGYFGALTNESLIGVVLLHPWREDIQSGFMVDANAIYTAYRFQNIPIELELEGDVAKRFGNDYTGRQWEFDLIPMARWTYLPWNNYIYTNFRLGLLGASYVTGVSQFEKNFDSSHHGNRFLNFLVPELTFSPSKDAPFEVFVGVHHRSGIFGLIDGVHGGSNYIYTGMRFSAF